MKKLLLAIVLMASSFLLYGQLPPPGDPLSLLDNGTPLRVYATNNTMPLAEKSLRRIPLMPDPSYGKLELGLNLPEKSLQLSSFVDQQVLPNSQTLLTLPFSTHNQTNMITNRRLKYMGLWAFTSLNYLYADVVGLMDAELLNQYQTGVVNGLEITPSFLTAAAAYMQLPLANVFLPLVIKDDKTLRWVQIICGAIATVAQGASLLVGEPAPYYILFSAIEMGVTAYITIDAIKWKPGRK
ncbi:MAG: DUF6326 family protein [Bacteroidota bacterium]